MQKGLGPEGHNTQNKTKEENDYNRSKNLTVCTSRNAKLKHVAMVKIALANNRKCFDLISKR